MFFSSSSSSPVLAPPFNCASFISHLESTLLCLSTLNPAPTQYGVVSERVLAVRGQALWAQEEQAGQTHTPVMRTSGVAFPTAALSLSLYQHAHYKHTRSHCCTIKQAFVSRNPPLHLLYTTTPITHFSPHICMQDHYWLHPKQKMSKLQRLSFMLCQHLERYIFTWHVKSLHPWVVWEV